MTEASGSTRMIWVGLLLLHFPVSVSDVYSCEPVPFQVQPISKESGQKAFNEEYVSVDDYLKWMQEKGRMHLTKTAAIGKTELSLSYNPPEWLAIMQVKNEDEEVDLASLIPEFAGTMQFKLKVTSEGDIPEINSSDLSLIDFRGERGSLLFFRKVPMGHLGNSEVYLLGFEKGGIRENSGFEVAINSNDFGEEPLRFEYSEDTMNKIPELDYEK